MVPPLYIGAIGPILIVYVISLNPAGIPGANILKPPKPTVSAPDPVMLKVLMLNGASNIADVMAPVVSGTVVVH